MALTYDIFTYNGEFDVLKIRLNILKNKVDKFIICEARHTFTGKSKPLYFEQVRWHLRQYTNKIEYYVLPESYTTEEIQLARQSPNTRGAAHWVTEFLQKESIKKALVKLNDDDICYIGDVDEIWEPVDIYPSKLKLRVYAYYLDNRSTEEFWGTYVDTYGNIKNECLNHLRSRTDVRTPEYYGWHFTSIGGYKEVQRKLQASYTDESYYTDQVRNNLRDRVHLGIDFLGRPFQFTSDESEWPFYLKKNRKKFAQLCKSTSIRSLKYRLTQ